MSNFITRLFVKLFGSKSSRDVKKILPLVAAVNEYFNQYQALNPDALREKTRALQERLQRDVQGTKDEITRLKGLLEVLPQERVHQREALFGQVAQEEKKAAALLDTSLETLLPEAFAIVKETARRFCTHEEIAVSATDADRLLAAQPEVDYVRVEGDVAIWKNTWPVGGSLLTWNMVPYDVQIFGGIVLHQGKIAEMATGEGKTLVAILPAFLNALSGKSVHVVTVNDYLAKRDAEWNAPIFQFHGLQVDCIDKYPAYSKERRKAYKAHVAYGTSSEFGFDYLRDNMLSTSEKVAQTHHHYAIVDEVDSILVDEARTPLIISGAVMKNNAEQFGVMKERVSTLYDVQRKLVIQYLNEAKQLIANGDAKAGGLSLFRAYRGLPKYKPLIKYLSQTGIKQTLKKTEDYYLQDNQRYMPEADAPLFFVLDEKSHSVHLTEKGVEAISHHEQDSQFFIVPDIVSEIERLTQDTSLGREKQQEEKAKRIKEYTEKAERIHIINQLLKAYTLYERDTDYVIMEGKVMIIDEQTGRIMEGRRYSDGIHQAIEAKEGVKVEEATQTYATVTLQNYFRMYHKLAGMTGTAETESAEFWEIYKLDVVAIPTNKPVVRQDADDKVYKTIREKFNAAIEEIVSLREVGRPVLVGTTSVEISETLSRMLNLRKIKHQVLNARHHEKEADIVAHAGAPGIITIATNMAGRGTDIKLDPDSQRAGGLAIVGTERHESRRIDRQLRGRAGRQGDPGSSQFFVSLEDNLMRVFASGNIAKWMDRMGFKEGEVIQHGMITRSIERAQIRVEENNFGMRRRLLKYDDIMNVQREAVYTRRRNALHGERLSLDLYTIMYDTVAHLVSTLRPSADYNKFCFSLFEIFASDLSLSPSSFETLAPAKLVDVLYRALIDHYQTRKEKIQQEIVTVLQHARERRGDQPQSVVIPFADERRMVEVQLSIEECLSSGGQTVIAQLEQEISLREIDTGWIDHLRKMDELRQSVQNVVYEQKDPLLVYKFEAFGLFKGFLRAVNEAIVSFLMKAKPPLPHEDLQAHLLHQPGEEAKPPHLVESKQASASPLPPLKANRAGHAPPPVAPIRSEKLAGRNDKVTVKYPDGTVKKEVKFKKVADDVRNNRCVLLSVHEEE